MARTPNIPCLHGSHGKDSTYQGGQGAVICIAVLCYPSVGLAVLPYPTFHLIEKCHLNFTMLVRVPQ